jgi:hypothetical protein
MLDKTGFAEPLLRDLQNWRSELSDIENKIAVLQKQRDAINKKVIAAEVLLGGNDKPEGESIRSLVIQLMSDGRRRKPKEIRRDLVARGLVEADRVHVNSGNLYNALVRLVNDEILKRDEESNYWNPAIQRDLEDMLK